MASSKEWNDIPTIVLTDVLSRLTVKDRLNASSTCTAWRDALFHPSLWQKITFKVTSHGASLLRDSENNGLIGETLDNGSKNTARCVCRKKTPNAYEDVGPNNDAASFLALRCGRFPSYVSIELDTRDHVDVKDGLHVLDTLTSNFNLQMLTIKPTSCQLKWRKSDCTRETPIPEEYTHKLLKIIRNAPGLRHLALGCIEELLEQSERFLSHLGQFQSKSLESLHLASVKTDPDHYMIPEIQAQLLEPFFNLRNLSLDYDYLNDDFLGVFARNGKPPLRFLSIHVHGIDQDHSGVSENAWNQLSAHSPGLEVSLTFLHANNPSSLLREIVRNNMPLVTFRSYYTQGVDRLYLELLTSFNYRTLRSLTLVEGPRNDAHWTSLGGSPPELEDPLVMLAWRCQKLMEMTIIGFEVSESDLIAIARLRGARLRKLAIPSCCIVSSPFLHWPIEEGNLNIDESYLCYDYSGEDAQAALLEEISSSLGCEWRPMYREELPCPFIACGASDDSTYMSTLLDDQCWLDLNRTSI